MERVSRPDIGYPRIRAGGTRGGLIDRRHQRVQRGICDAASSIEIQMLKPEREIYISGVARELRVENSAVALAANAAGNDALVGIEIDVINAVSGQDSDDQMRIHPKIGACGIFGVIKVQGILEG